MQLTNKEELKNELLFLQLIAAVHYEQYSEALHILIEINGDSYKKNYRKITEYALKVAKLDPKQTNRIKYKKIFKICSFYK